MERLKIVDGTGRKAEVYGKCPKTPKRQHTNIQIPYSMKIFFSESENDYSTYTFSYAAYAVKEAQNELPQIYERGFLPYTSKPEIEPEITGKYRVGDIRHCFADIGAARRQLGFEPATDLEVGLSGLVDWVSRQTAVDRVGEATGELVRRGLVA